MAQALSDLLDQERPAADKERRPVLPVAGVIAGLLVPIAGIAIAIVLFLRGDVGPGLAACLASFLGLLAAFMFL